MLSTAAVDAERRRTAHDAAYTKGLPARRVLPARLGCDGLRRVRVGVVGIRLGTHRTREAARDVA